MAAALEADGTQGRAAGPSEGLPPASARARSFRPRLWHALQFRPPPLLGLGGGRRRRKARSPTSRRLLCPRLRRRRRRFRPWIGTAAGPRDLADVASWCRRPHTLPEGLHGSGGAAQQCTAGGAPLVLKSCFETYSEGFL